VIQVKMKINVAALTAITVKTPTPIVLPLFMVAMTHLRATLSSYLDLDEPYALAPLVLADENPAEVGETGGRVVERPQDLVPLRDRQREHLGLDVVSVLKTLSHVVEAGAAAASQARGRRHREPGCPPVGLDRP
jgi:hypothetical protein